jgi:hypothetical protein
MSIGPAHRTLLELLEQKRARNHYKVALRYYFMLEALSHPVPPAHQSYCVAAMRRCAPRDLERIRRTARDWAAFAHASPSVRPASIDFGPLVEHVLCILARSDPSVN